MRRLSDGTLANWLEQVAEGLDSGMLASDAVAITKSLPATLQERLVRYLEGGDGWALVFRELEFGFSVAEYEMLVAAAETARLPIALRQTASRRKQRIKAKKRIAMGIAYPVLVVHFAAVVFAVTHLLDGDWLKFCISVGVVLIPFWSFVSIVILFRKFFPGGWKTLQRGLPFLSGYRKYGDWATLAYGLGTSLDVGMPVKRAWMTALAAVDDARFDRFGEQVMAAVERGEPASSVFAEFPKLIESGFAQVYRSGEKTGRLPQNLLALAERYQKDSMDKLFLATMVYPKILLLAVFGYVGYRIVMYYKDYYQGIIDMSI